LELPDVRANVGPFNEAALSYRWTHPDHRVDVLQRDIEQIVLKATAAGASRRQIFHQAWKLVQRALDHSGKLFSDMSPCLPRAAVPYLNEPWYC
jgi:hypothetical protein